MFLQKMFKMSLIASFLLLVPSALLADLVITTNQVDPVPPACAIAGGTITFAINVFNSGPGAVRCIEFDESLTSAANPAGICLSTASGAECLKFCIEARSNGFHAKSRETLEAGQSFTFVVTFRICTAPTDTLTNTVIVTAKDCKGPISSELQTTACVSGCALTVSLTPSVTTQVCSNGSVTFVADVAGNCEPTSGLTFVWTDQNSNILTATVPGILTLSAQQIVPFGTITSVTVTVTDNFSGCSASATSGTVSGAACADLAITKTATVAHGVVTYHITVTNNGPDASAVQVTDCLPACLTPLQVNVGDVPQWSYFVNNNCVVATFIGQNPATVPGSVLLPGQSASFDIVAQIDKCTCGKSVCNTATVRGNVFDPNISNNSATVKIKTKKRK